MRLDELWLFGKHFFWSDSPKRPQRGYFKDFWLIFIILGFKGLKIGQKRKILSQISCIWTKYNVIIKKNSSDPQTPHGGRKRGNLRKNFDVFFCINHTHTTSLELLWLKITLKVSSSCLDRPKCNFFQMVGLWKALFIKKVPFCASKMWLLSLSSPVGTLI